MKKVVSLFLALYLVFSNNTTLEAISPDISATAAIVMDAQTGFILYERNIHEPRYPASIVKVMTALLALEQYSTRLYEPILFSHNAVYSIPFNSSHIAMNKGETLSMEDALYAIMLSSANEVANAIAEHIGGSTESFASLMTRRANAMGAENTNFTNPSGLHDSQQVSTAYDMALITREAIRHPKFLELISSVRHDIPPTEYQPLVRELLNTNRLIRAGEHFNESVIGGKTGFTSEAQHTLITYAERDGRELIVVTLQGTGPRLYTDTTSLLEYGFAMPYERQPLFYRNQHAHTLPVYSDWSRQGTQVGNTRLIVPEDIYLSLPPGFDISEAEFQLYTPARLTVPIQAGQNIGRVVYGIRGITLGDVQLRAADTILPPVVDIPEEVVEETQYAQASAEIYALPLTNFEVLLDNYFLTIVLPLIIFIVGLVVSTLIIKVHRNRKQARLGRYSVIGYHYKRR